MFGKWALKAGLRWIERPLESTQSNARECIINVYWWVCRKHCIYKKYRLNAAGRLKSRQVIRLFFVGFYKQKQVCLSFLAPSTFNALARSLESVKSWLSAGCLAVTCVCDRSCAAKEKAMGKMQRKRKNNLMNGIILTQWESSAQAEIRMTRSSKKCETTAALKTWTITSVPKITFVSVPELLHSCNS